MWYLKANEFVVDKANDIMLSMAEIFGVKGTGQSGRQGFLNGIQRINGEIGFNENDKLKRYIKQTLPIIDKDSGFPFLVEMCIDDE